MRLSDIIEEFIKRELNGSGSIQLKRNELASRFECAPSQINYVLSTRFGSDRGYYVESRRGGGGYIRVVKVQSGNDDYVKNTVFKDLKDGMSYSLAQKIVKSLREREIITSREEKIILASLNDRAISVKSESERNSIRANIFRNIIINII